MPTVAMTLQSTYNAAPDTGYEGQLWGDSFHDITTMRNDEASVSIPFGRAVVFPTSPTVDMSAKLPSGSLTRPAGLVVFSHNYARVWTAADGTVNGDLDSTGLRPGVHMNILRRGRILVKTQQAVVPGDRLFICKTAATTYSAVGQLGNADESTNTIDATTVGVWLTSAAAGALAVLDVDFTNEAL